MVVAVAVAVVGVVAAVARRRRPDPPTQAPVHQAPTQLDRRDFGDPAEPWLVVAFTSRTCDGCAQTWAKAEVLASSEVAVREVEYAEQRELHERYSITGVPTVVVAGADGAVVWSSIGPPSATHLWAAVARARDPESVPPGCGGDH